MTAIEKSENLSGRKARGKAQKLPVYEKRSADGRLTGYLVRIRRQGFQPVSQVFGDPLKTSAQNRAEAEKFAADTLAEMQLGKRAERGEVEGLTLRDALLRYQREVAPGRKMKGQAEIQRHINRWSGDVLAERTIADLRPLDFARFRDERLASDAAPATVKLELAFVRSVWTTGIKEWGWPVANPISSIRLPRVSNARDRRLETGEEERLLTACAASKSLWVLPAVRLALEMAARQGELLALEWPYIDWDRATAHLPDTKNGDARTVPLSPAAYTLLWEMRCAARTAGANDDRVLPLGQMTLVHAFKNACKRAKIENLRFHDLRHEAVSRLFERGFNVAEAASVSGHKTLAMLKRYTHLRAADLARKLEAVA